MMARDKPPARAWQRMLSGRRLDLLDPSPLVTHHMPLEEAAEAYAVYDRREALKIVMRP